MSFQRGRKDGNSFAKNLPFGLSYSDVGANENRELPTIPMPVNGMVLPRERDTAIQYMNLVTAVREGPFYTGSMQLSVDGQGKDLKLVDEDGINDGVERYSDRYLKKRKIGVSIDEHPFHLEFFPDELYQVMGINKKKLLAISQLNKRTEVFTGSAAQNEDAEGLSMLEKLKNLADEEDESASVENKEELEDVDDEFDSDEDEDYNAEKYFDDGDDDAGEEDGYGDEPAF
ncbi:LAME_0H06106g1_1 [Lachancea meyersii CBS 8951]|uniref:DNA-directed RNA polymerase III subunit n=1 Tax=Lachancea meyersii CBS 8951 TaxID=1266667 RepID=A0A1G4KEP2_9SACH|nr:LAME_0H06106g1_1 [Lachancea meyersii CBS 8951]